MTCAEESPRSRASEDRIVVRLVEVECGEHRRGLFRHLMQAAEEIAQRDNPPGGAFRFAAAAARFRDMGYGPRRQGIGPVVVLEGGAVVPLSDLLAAAWLHDRGAFPDHGIDPEMLEAARQLLLDLAWQLPQD